MNATPEPGSREPSLPASGPWDGWVRFVPTDYRSSQISSTFQSASKATLAAKAVGR